MSPDIPPETASRMRQLEIALIPLASSLAELEGFSVGRVGFAKRYLRLRGDAVRPATPDDVKIVVWFSTRREMERGLSQVEHVLGGLPFYAQAHVEKTLSRRARNARPGDPLPWS